jgi:hypothetical protein
MQGSWVDDASQHWPLLPPSIDFTTHPQWPLAATPLPLPARSHFVSSIWYFT